MQRLIPDPGATTIEEQMAGFDPGAAAGSERPHVFTNFAVTVDGHATISGRSGEIGTGTDTAMLMALRASAEAVMVGAGTLRAESYGRLLPNSETRAGRERRGLSPDPLAVVVSNRMELPWDAGLFTSGAGQVLVFTASEEDPPETATPMEVIRHQGSVDLVAALKHLRAERGIRALLCEGGPHLHGDLLDAGVVDGAVRNASEPSLPAAPAHEWLRVWIRARSRLSSAGSYRMGTSCSPATWSSPPWAPKPGPDRG